MRNGRHFEIDTFFKAVPLISFPFAKKTLAPTYFFEPDVVEVSVSRQIFSAILYERFYTRRPFRARISTTDARNRARF